MQVSTLLFWDQDGVWERNKIKKTLAKIHDVGKSLADNPILVNTDFKAVDQDLKVLDNFMGNSQWISPKLTHERN